MPRGLAVSNDKAQEGLSGKTRLNKETICQI